VALSGVGNTWIVWSIDGKLLENFDRHDLKDRFLGGLDVNLGSLNPLRVELIGVEPTQDLGR